MIKRNDFILRFKKTNISVVRYDGEMHVKNIMKFFILIRFFSFVGKMYLNIRNAREKEKIIKLLILLI